MDKIENYQRKKISANRYHLSEIQQNMMKCYEKAFKIKTNNFPETKDFDRGKKIVRE